MGTRRMATCHCSREHKSNGSAADVALKGSPWLTPSCAAAIPACGVRFFKLTATNRQIALTT